MIFFNLSHLSCTKLTQLPFFTYTKNCNIASNNHQQEVMTINNNTTHIRRSAKIIWLWRVWIKNVQTFRLLSFQSLLPIQIIPYTNQYKCTKCNFYKNFYTSHKRKFAQKKTLGMLSYFNTSIFSAFQETCLNSIISFLSLKKSISKSQQALKISKTLSKCYTESSESR